MKDTKKFLEINIELKQKIDSFKKEYDEIEKQLKENRNTFKTWAEEKFYKVLIGGDYVTLLDKKFSYKFVIEDNILKMKKINTFDDRFNRGCGVRYPFFDMGRHLDIGEDEVVVYEGGIVPENKKKEEIDLFPILKEDLIKRGEISTIIKKYIGEDYTKRIEWQHKQDDIKLEKQKLEDQKYSNRREYMKTYTKDILSKMFAEKTIITSNENYIIRGRTITYDNIGRNQTNVDSDKPILSLTFLKETAKQYHFEYAFSDGTKKLEKISKSTFSIGCYIDLV